MMENNDIGHKSYSVNDWLDYLEKKVSPVQKTEMESLLKISQIDRDVLRGVLVIYKQHGQDRNATEAYYQKIAQNSPIPSQKPIPNIRKLSLFSGAVAAATVFFLLLFPTFFRSPLDETVTGHLAALQEEKATVTRSSNTAVWKSAFNSGEYDAALKALTSHLNTSDTSDEERYFAGLTYLLKNDPDVQKALPLLEAVAKGESVFKVRAQWLLALLQLQAGQKPEAKIALTVIHKSGEAPYSSDADALLELLEQ